MKNRIGEYEPGWLSFLVAAGLATREEARKAVQRVAEESTRELDEQQKRWREERKRRRGQ